MQVTGIYTSGSGFGLRPEDNPQGPSFFVDGGVLDIRRLPRSECRDNGEGAAAHADSRIKEEFFTFTEERAPNLTGVALHP